MSVQFRLGHGDHKCVEDFLVRGARGTSAIVLDAKAANRHQLQVAEAARDVGVAVLYEPATERLAAPEFGLEKFPSYSGSPYDVARLAVEPHEREKAVELVLAAHPDLATYVTPPHFYVDGAESAHLNVTLAEMTRLADSRPVRAVLTISNRFAKSDAEAVALEYVAAGIESVELRLNPFGGEDLSLKKIRDGFATLDVFRAAGIRVTLGQSGSIGRVAVALGHAHAYSVGIGMLERVDHKTQVRRQAEPPKPRTDEDPGGGPQAGVYLPGPDLTLPRRVAGQLLENTNIRTRIGCRTGVCGESIRGPMADARGHYLHARADAMVAMQETPPAWRATAELERLHGALQLRRLINQQFTGGFVSELKVRTLTSLIDDAEAHREAS